MSFCVGIGGTKRAPRNMTALGESQRCYSACKQPCNRTQYSITQSKIAFNQAEVWQKNMLPLYASVKKLNRSTDRRKCSNIEDEYSMCNRQVPDEISCAPTNWTYYYLSDDCTCQPTKCPQYFVSLHECRTSCGILQKHYHKMYKVIFRRSEQSSRLYCTNNTKWPLVSRWTDQTICLWPIGEQMHWKTAQHIILDRKCIQHDGRLQSMCS